MEDYKIQLSSMRRQGKEEENSTPCGKQCFELEPYEAEEDPKDPMQSHCPLICKRRLQRYSRL